MNLEIGEELDCDVLVIGTEGTGARAAIEAALQGCRVVAVTKGLHCRSGSTLTADGEIDVDSRSALEMFGVNGSPDDSPEVFANDMIRGGDYLANQCLVSIHTQEAPQRIQELFDWGANSVGFIHAPGHSYPRGLWIPGDRLTRLLGRRMRKAGVSIIENLMITSLLWDKDGVVGAVGLDHALGRLVVIRCRALVMATGGAMRLFPLVTAPDDVTGDGLAMALHAGAELQDMEFPMFLPYCFNNPPALRGVIFSYDASALLEAHALNRHGQRYMARWDPERMERSTRDINSVGSAMEILAGRGSKSGGTYLSFKHLPQNLLDFSAEWFPGNLRNWKAAGFNLKDFFPGFDAAWEVAPACHFWNGGVRINEQCETGIPGFFAAGEGTAGIHGANRLAGNALTMTQVWGRRAGFYAANYAKNTGLRELPRQQVEDTTRRLLRLRRSGSGPRVVEVRQKIREVAGELVGIVRDEGRLNRALEAIASLRGQLEHQQAANQDARFNREWVEGLQNENLLDVLECVVRASLERRESRGAMYRLDYPDTDDSGYLCNLVLKLKEGQWEVRREAVQEEYVSLPRGRRPYGRKWEGRDETR